MSNETFQNARSRNQRRDSSTMAAFAAISMIGFGALIISYPYWRARPKPHNQGGFNVARVIGADSTVAVPSSVPAAPYSVRGPGAAMLPPPTPMAGQQQQQGLRGTVRTPTTPTGGTPEENFVQAMASHQKMYSDLQDSYIAKYPVVKRFFDEWRSNPALVRLTENWDQNHNVMQFGRNAVKSPQFASIATRYLRNSDFRQFVINMAVSSPKDVTDSLNQVARDDSTARQLGADFLTSVGLPGSMVKTLSSGNADPHQAASQFMATMPGLPGGLDINALQQQIQQGQQR